MPLSHATNHSDEELERYVLGLLSDEAALRLDEDAIADDEVATRLHTVETDLIDSYVRGRLAGPTRERFESYYLSSPRRRDNVRLAASFIRAIDAMPRDEGVTWASRLVRVSRLTPLVAAAALVIVVAGVFLFQVPRPRNEGAATTPKLAAGEPPSSGARPQSTGEPAGTRSASAPSATAPVPTNQESRTLERVAAIVLPPPTRDVAALPTLTVPADTGGVRFELRLESNDFSHYRVGLRDPATGTLLWRSDWLPPATSRDQASVPVIVPANLLRSQHYSLELTGRGTGEADVIGSYPVRIDRQ